MDMDNAVRWFTASADQENMYARYALGKIYLYGKGVNRDYEKAVALLTAAATQETHLRHSFWTLSEAIGIGA